MAVRRWRRWRCTAVRGCTRGQVALGRPHLFLDEVEVVEQPFAGRRDAANRIGAAREQRTTVCDDPFVVAEPGQQVVTAASSSQLVPGCQVAAVLLHLLGREELGTQRCLVDAVRGAGDRPATERAQPPSKPQRPFGGEPFRRVHKSFIERPIARQPAAGGHQCSQARVSTMFESEQTRAGQRPTTAPEPASTSIWLKHCLRNGQGSTSPSDQHDRILPFHARALRRRTRSASRIPGAGDRRRGLGSAVSGGAGVHGVRGGRAGGAGGPGFATRHACGHRFSGMPRRTGSIAQVGACPEVLTLLPTDLLDDASPCMCDTAPTSAAGANIIEPMSTFRCGRSRNRR